MVISGGNIYSCIPRTIVHGDDCDGLVGIMLRLSPSRLYTFFLCTPVSVRTASVRFVAREIAMLYTLIFRYICIRYLMRIMMLNIVYCFKNLVFYL